MHPSRPVLLYDECCGFCRWCVARVLAVDRGGVLDPRPIQSPVGERYLAGMDPDRRLASWHLVTADGTVHSAGAAAAPLARLLPPVRALAPLFDAAPGLVERLYAFGAGRRGWFGRRLSRRAVDAASAAIARRAAAVEAEPAGSGA